MNMPMLDNMQQKFWSGLTSEDNSVHACINSNLMFDKNERMDVYRTNARSLYVSVISDDYPVCKKILGDDYFKLIAKKYYQSHPSLSFDLNEYGNDFAGYLETLLIERSELKDYSYLADLAILENAVKKAHYAKDEAVFSLAGYELDENSIFSLRADVAIQQSSYPVHTLWHMHQGTCESPVIENDKDEYHLCVFRDNYNVNVCELEAHVFSLLKCIKSNYTLGEIINTANETMKVNQALEYALIRNWLVI